MSICANNFVRLRFLFNLLRKSCAILHPWLKSELESILTTLPPAPERTLEENRALWASWQAEMTVKYTLPRDPVPLRMILIWDNLIGHHSGNIVLWLYQHGIMPLFTPIKGSWLNMRVGSTGCRFAQDRQRACSALLCVVHWTERTPPHQPK